MNPTLICACTLGNPPFDELLAIAAEQNVDGLSLWQSYIEEQLAAGWTLDAMRRRLQETGVRVALMEACTRWSQTTGFDDAARGEAAALVALAKALEAPQILAVNLESAAALDGMAESFRELCAFLAEEDLRCAVEFLPWTGLADLASTRVLLDAASEYRPQVMLDSWHVFRGTTSLEEIAALPADSVMALQLNDFKGDGQRPSGFAETMSQRCLPGEGWFDLPALIQALRASGNNAPLTVELMQLDGSRPARQLAEESQAALQALLARC
ncbi:MAG TPA: sugar phosphate isomerase/epimerase [Spongiibacteraceae bacterium]|nr:sugar phosphate isomerase/epimerase [Spongiibacteraceae bacterium]